MKIKLITIFIVLLLTCSSFSVVHASPVSFTASQFSSNLVLADYWFDPTGIINSITNVPKKVADAFLDAIFKPISDYLYQDIYRNVQLLNSSMQVFKDMLTQEDLNSSTYSFSKSLWGALKPIGYSFVSLFFVISLCKKSIYFEMMNELEVYKQLIKLIFTKEMVDHSYELMALIVNINKDIVNTVFSLINYANNTAIIKYVSNQTTITIMQQIMNEFKTQFMVTIILICLMICQVMVVLRQVEIAVLSAVSALFFSTFAGESTSDVFKGFIKNFVSVVAQTIWISCALGFLMNGYLSSITIDPTGLMVGAAGINFIVGSVALAIYTIQAPSSVKNAIGGSGGVSISLTSLLMAMR